VCVCVCVCVSVCALFIIDSIGFGTKKAISCIWKNIELVHSGFRDRDWDTSSK
jgi:hypothetical protein